jgi:hypothetical protein
VVHGRVVRMCFNKSIKALRSPLHGHGVNTIRVHCFSMFVLKS